MRPRGSGGRWPARAGVWCLYGLACQGNGSEPRDALEADFEVDSDLDAATDTVGFDEMTGGTTDGRKQDRFEEQWSIPCQTIGVRGAGTFAFSSDQSLMAVGSVGHVVKVLRTGDWSNTVWTTPTAFPRDMTFSPDQSMLAVSSGYPPVKLLRVSDGAIVRTLGDHVSVILALAFSPDSMTLALAGDGVQTFRVSDGAPERNLTTAGAVGIAAAFLRDGATLTTVSSPFERAWVAEVWDARSGSRIRELASGDPDGSGEEFHALSPHGPWRDICDRFVGPNCHPRWQ